MNNTITVTGTDRATLAAAWCNKHYNESEWALDISNTMFSKGDYHFRFRNDNDASEFALRWC